jgi:ribosomal protein L12E/L44/L45/RPP1/RPP2
MSCERMASPRGVVSSVAAGTDVVCDQRRWVHFAVKAVERLNIEEAMEQARADARKSGNRESGKAESPSGRAPENGLANGTSQMA